MRHVELDNYYDGSKIMVDLDEKLDPKSNAQKYYNKYQKAKIQSMFCMSRLI